MTERTACLTLSGLEAVFMSDAVRNSQTPLRALDESDETRVIRPLLLNLGSAYRELVTVDGIAPGPVSFEVTEPQCWLMRTLVRTGDLAIDGKSNVGVSLLTKLYGLLLELESGLDLPSADVEDAPYVKEAVDARPDNDTSADSCAIG